MLGDKQLLGAHFGQRTSFMGQLEETRYFELIQQKDKQIKSLKRSIKKLQKQLKLRNQMTNSPQKGDGTNSFLKNVLQREVSRYNQLRKIIISATIRIKKLSFDANQQISISQNGSSMQNIVDMLEKINFSKGKSSRISGSQISESDEIIQIDEAIDQLQIGMRELLLKFGENNKNYKSSIQIHKLQQQDIKHYQQQIKKQKKSKDLLQKLLQKNQREKNEFVNQINISINKEQIQSLKHKTKEEIISYSQKLCYRIKDLQIQKQQIIKSTTKQMQKQMKLYQQLLGKVRNFKGQCRIQQSIS